MRGRVCALTGVLGLDPLRQSLVHVLSDLWFCEGGGQGGAGRSFIDFPGILLQGITWLRVRLRGGSLRHRKY